MAGKLRSRLIELFATRSLLTGRFTLSSGKTSHFYFDAKRTTLHPEGAYLAARLILECFCRQGFRSRIIGGLTLGADPVVAAVAAISFAEAQYPEVSGLIVRKEPKGHGTQVWIEGLEAPPGTPVVVVDDVCTTGTSTLRAIRRIEEAGYRVEAVIALVDREQGGKEALASYPFFPILRAAEIMDDPGIRRKLEEAGAGLQ